MQLVYIPGVWDLLHVGHVTILERARALGDRLVVGVPSDEVVASDKGLPPIVPLVDRLKMLMALRCVDVAVPYFHLEFLTHLRMFKPSILAVGDPWGTCQRHRDAEKWIEQNGGRCIRLPYTPGVSTSQLKERLDERA